METTFLTATAAHIDSDTRTVDITLEDGQVYRCSLATVSDRLRLVDPSLLQEWEWIGPRAGMHWPGVDEDLSIEHLIANSVRCNTQDAAVKTPRKSDDHQQ